MMMRLAVGVVVGEPVGVRKADIVAMDIVDVGVGEGVDEGDEPVGRDVQDMTVSLLNKLEPLLILEVQPDTQESLPTTLPLHAESLYTVPVAPIAVHAIEM